MGNVQEVCKKAMLRFIVEDRSCRSDFPIFDEQFVAVDDVRTRSMTDCILNAHPIFIYLSCILEREREKKGKKGPKMHHCLSSSESIVWPNEEAHGECNGHEAMLLRAREL